MVMDRVGGFADYLSLLADARAYEDVMIVLAAEADARRQQKQQQAREAFGEAADLEPVATWVNEPVEVA